MPTDQFPPNEPTGEELILRELENGEVKLDPSITLSHLLFEINRKRWSKFLVSADYDIFIILKDHREVAIQNQIEVILDGSFTIDRSSKEIKFDYYANSSVHKKPKDLRKVVENKIKVFLKSKGIEFEDKI